MPVMLDVKSVVKEQNVIEPAVVTDYSARVLVVSLQIAQTQTGHKSRQIDAQQKGGSEHEHRPPQSDYCDTVERLQPRVKSATAVMREMPRSPKRLGKAEQQAEVTRKDRIYSTTPKKWPVDEVVRYCVRIPPQAECDERDCGQGQEQTAMSQREQNKQR